MIKENIILLLFTCSIFIGLSSCKNTQGAKNFEGHSKKYSKKTTTFSSNISTSYNALTVTWNSQTKMLVVTDNKIEVHKERRNLVTSIKIKNVSGRLVILVDNKKLHY